jgi:hypothetical protein
MKLADFCPPSNPPCFITNCKWNSLVILSEHIWYARYQLLKPRGNAHSRNSFNSCHPVPFYLNPPNHDIKDYSTGLNYSQPHVNTYHLLFPTTCLHCYYPIPPENHTAQMAQKYYLVLCHTLVLNQELIDKQRYPVIRTYHPIESGWLVCISILW